MKHLIILFTFISINLNAQNYVGAELGRNNYGFTLYNELEPDSSFVVGGFKTVVSENSEIKLRAGVKIGSPKLHVVLYLPVLNYSFEAKKFNTLEQAEADIQAAYKLWKKEGAYFNPLKFKGTELSTLRMKTTHELLQLERYPF